MDVRPDDRILLAEIPAPEVVRALAARASRGIVVAMGSDDAVRAARRAAADLDNVMFVPAPDSEDPRIPWQDGFFTKIVAGEPDPELLRVLAPGGSFSRASDT